MSEPRRTDRDTEEIRRIKQERYRDRAFVESYDTRYGGGLNELNTLVERAWITSRARGLVLDAGAGTGRFTVHLAGRGFKVMALDSSSGMLAGLRAKLPGLPALQGDIFRLPLADESVDTLVCMHLLFHLPDWRNALAEFSRVLAPGGRLLFEMRSGEHTALAGRVLGMLGRRLRSESADLSGATCSATSEEVRNALHACGFGIEARLGYDLGHTHYLSPLAAAADSLLGRMAWLRTPIALTERVLGRILPRCLLYRSLYCGVKR